MALSLSLMVHDLSPRSRSRSLSPFFFAVSEFAVCCFHFLVSAYKEKDKNKGKGQVPSAGVHVQLRSRDFGLCIIKLICCLQNPNLNLKTQTKRHLKFKFRPGNCLLLGISVVNYVRGTELWSGTTKNISRLKKEEQQFKTKKKKTKRQMSSGKCSRLCIKCFLFSCSIPGSFADRPPACYLGFLLSIMFLEAEGVKLEQHKTFQDKKKKRNRSKWRRRKARWTAPITIGSTISVFCSQVRYLVALQTGQLLAARTCRYPNVNKFLTRLKIP